MYWGQEPAIKLAKQALKNFVHSLPLGSKFNVIGFGSRYVPLFSETVTNYNEESMKKALDDIATYD